ncbi:MAG TPA: glycoside hydrolase family 25 protein [Terriglobales bacterium]|nr:glycoside hydrolase family 25 protein [Terriglobales bacterium]
MPAANVVVDLSHHNQGLDFGQIKTAGILGIIHKATQGTTYLDPSYGKHKAAALDQGLLWGAYAFGTGADVVEQAQHFLDAVEPDNQTLLALDIEANPQGPSMNLEEARGFVTHIKEATSNWPVLYSGYYIKQLLGSTLDPVLAHCPLWLSQYGPTPVVPVNWQTWTLWQYTDGAAGPEPHEVAGAGLCDRNFYNGEIADLTANWGSSLQLQAKAQII